MILVLSANLKTISDDGDSRCTVSLGLWNFVTDILKYYMLITSYLLIFWLLFYFQHFWLTEIKPGEGYE